MEKLRLVIIRGGNSVIILTKFTTGYNLIVIDVIKLILSCLKNENVVI